MPRKIFIIVLLLLAAMNLQAQNLIKGKVTDREGTPLTGVNVLLHQNLTGTTTQADGTYQLVIPSYLKVD
ncbi:MAG: carboxypeptidase-like regulatory domain-containing protein, partial [Cyclobacteriaceae bacterium]